MKKLKFKNAGNKEKNTPGEYQSIEGRKPMISLFKSRTLCAPPLHTRRLSPPLAALPPRDGAGPRVSTVTPHPTLNPHPHPPVDRC